MYAIYWKCEKGLTGNGELILDYETLIAWLSHLRRKYPNMEHWGEDETGRRLEISSIDSPKHRSTEAPKHRSTEAP